MSRKVICFLSLLLLVCGALFYDDIYAAPSGSPPPIYTKKPLPNPRQQEVQEATKVVGSQEKKIVTTKNLNIISTHYLIISPVVLITNT